MRHKVQGMRGMRYEVTTLPYLLTTTAVGVLRKERKKEESKQASKHAGRKRDEMRWGGE